MISIAIPFYNEEKNAKSVVEGLVCALGKSGIGYELVLVNNGSLDNTPKILEELHKKYKKTKIIRVYPNQGFGWGVLSGMKVASGDVVGFMCGDGQVHPKDLIKIIKKFEKESLDFCQVKRIKRDDGFYRLLLSKGFNLIVHVLFKIPTSDMGGNPKIMKRELFEKLDLKSKDWFLETEMLSKMGKLNVKSGEVPIEFKKRKEGKSSIKFSVVFQFLKNVVVYKLSGEKL